MSKSLAQALIQGKALSSNQSKIYDQLIQEKVKFEDRAELYLVVFEAINQEIVNRAQLGLSLMRNINQEYHLLFLGWIFQAQPEIVNQYIRYTDLHGHTYQVAALEYSLRKIKQNTNLSSNEKEKYLKLVRNLFVSAGADLNQLVQKPLQTQTNAVLFTQGQTLAQLYPPNEWSDQIKQISCTLLDNLKLCDQPIGFDTLIRQRAQKILMHQARVKSRSTIRIHLHYAIKWYNWPAIYYFLQQGIVLNFSRLSELLGRMSEMKRRKDSVGQFVYLTTKRMLQGLIDGGTHLDGIQLDFIKRFDPAIGQNLQSAYQRPLWQKVCSLNDHTTPGRVPPSLFKMLIELNLFDTANASTLPNVSLTGVCQQLEALDPEELRQQIVDYNQRHLQEEFCSLCSNSEQLVVDPLTQNDLLASAYRDSKGSVMCYPADMFPRLLETKIDPLTKQPLPADFLQDIRGKNSQLVKLGIIPPAAVRLSLPALGGVYEGLANLQQSAQITTEISDQIETIFQELWSTEFGSEAELPHWTPAKLNFLQQLAQLDLEPLINSASTEGENLAYRSAQYIIIKFISTHPKQAQQTLQRLKNLSNLKQKPFERTGMFANFV